MKKAETPSLTYSPRNAWDVYTTATQKRQMDALVKRYMDFLSNCKTERETVAYVQKRLQEAGFSEDFKKNTVFRNLRGKEEKFLRRYRHCQSFRYRDPKGAVILKLPAFEGNHFHQAAHALCGQQIELSCIDRILCVELQIYNIFPVFDCRLDLHLLFSP